MTRLGLVALALLAGGCAAGREAPLLQIVEIPNSESRLAAGTTRLVLRVLPGARINARLKPALELQTGEIYRFDSPLLTPDSAYFTAMPTLDLPESVAHSPGLVRAGICLEGETVCRTTEVAWSP